MIVSYRDKRTSEFAAGKRVKAFSGFARSAQLKLDRLEAAVSVRDLASLPGNRFETLSGDRGASTAFVSTTSGASVSSGRTVRSAQSTSRSSIIVRGTAWDVRRFIPANSSPKN